MSTEASPRVRTTIIKVPDASPGLVFINGQQKSFTLGGVWKSPVAPAANMTVDVDLDGGGNITGVTVVDQKQANKERMEQLSGVAQQKGKEAAKLAQEGVGALAARMGKVQLGAAVLFVIGFFFFPAASLMAGFGAAKSLSLWDLSGIDFSSLAGLAALEGAGGGHGIFAILGLIAIAAPFAVPFIKTPWIHYLNAAPLAYLLLSFITTYYQTNKAFGDLTKMGAPNPFSWSWGLYLLGVVGLVLAAHALKPPAKA